jgi:uncharacterized damage-inducible protein DinB
MKTKDILIDLLIHEQWGNHLVVQTMHGMEEIPNRAATLIGHMVASQHVWISRIQGVQFTMDVFPALSLDACGVYFDAHHKQLMQWAQNPEMRHSTIAYTTTAGVAHTNTVEELLSHICLHSQYHRGQINQLIRPLVELTHDVDYIQYLRSKI